jgi:hypothetical protein
LKEELQKSKEEKQELQRSNEDQRTFELTRFRQYLEQREEEIEKLKRENCEIKKREEQFRLKSTKQQQRHQIRNLRKGFRFSCII